MTNREDKNLSSLEKYLQELMQKTERQSFTTEEVMQILESCGPLEYDALEDDEIVAIMQNTYEEQIEAERKIADKSLIRSLGELLGLFFDLNEVSISRFAAYLNMTEKELRDHVKDRRPPEFLGRDRVLDMMALLRIGIDEMVLILDKTRALLRIKKDTNLAATHARADKDQSEISRHSITSDAMKELLQTIEESEYKVDKADSWEEFKRVLVEKASEDKPPDKLTDTCFTLKPSFLGH